MSPNGDAWTADGEAGELCGVRQAIAVYWAGCAMVLADSRMFCTVSLFGLYLLVSLRCRLRRRAGFECV